MLKDRAIDEINNIATPKKLLTEQHLHYKESIELDHSHENAKRSFRSFRVIPYEVIDINPTMFQEGLQKIIIKKYQIYAGAG
eukprot:g47370.t1